MGDGGRGQHSSSPAAVMGRRRERSEAVVGTRPGHSGRSSSEAVDRCSPGEGEREGIGLSVGVVRGGDCYSRLDGTDD